MKSTKLSLKELKVDSFITSLESHKTNTVKGGTSGGCAAAAGLLVIVAVTAAGAYVANDMINDIDKKQKADLKAIQDLNK